MVRFKQIKFGILALFFLSAFSVPAQENRCNLKIRVFESTEAISIIEADITVRNLNTNEVFSNENQIDEFVFYNLPPGDYEITTRKENFKQSIDKFSLNCKNLDRADFYVQGVTLWAGDSKEKVETDDRGKNAFVTAPLFVGTQALDEEAVKKKKEERLKKFAKLNDILNSEATYLEKPKFPRAAQAVKASGIVFVKIVIDEKGGIESAQAVSGHPLLHPAAAEAAQKAKFKPTVIDGKPVKVSGFLIYSFVL